ncbi:hypothetical protein BO83DRAFT_105920 [Aspergillus eucalypticola CBS 122712]|uniref:Uncharacterized protein n=1 Tax=Aspergillus eucalypticola (strain CBS 122712 / IBT 29274) TaxID=1448314 RepID=A0A317V2W3_ASPEC|nr:uncharacterized protein BO83DRAFT_105920 [Aspergillus eucalypticola CBS 122712]PWY66530.1 hypothetical protein BO83DRAFT_105920 [Aspergillus eucalypticola CBS 122712]
MTLCLFFIFSSSPPNLILLVRQMGNYYLLIENSSRLLLDQIPIVSDKNLEGGRGKPKEMLMEGRDTSTPTCDNHC